MCGPTRRIIGHATTCYALLHRPVYSEVRRYHSTRAKQMDTHAIRASLKICILWFATVLLTPAVEAAGIDLHRMWDDRCYDCHGHSAEFARKFLSVSNGELQGRHHVQDLRQFMHNHYVADSEVEAVYTMLYAQVSNQARFKDDCSRCHQTAAVFARRSLEFREGVLYGRKSGLPVRRFLDTHRGLDPDEVDFFTKLLTRVANEVYRP